MSFLDSVKLALQNKKQSSAISRWDTDGAPLQILTPWISPCATALLISEVRPSDTKRKR
jgi:hypothetical protein